MVDVTRLGQRAAVVGDILRRKSVEYQHLAGQVARAEEPVGAYERPGLRNVVAGTVEVDGAGLTVVAGKNDGLVTLVRSGA
jgi:hypothetical protein